MIQDWSKVQWSLVNKGLPRNMAFYFYSHLFAAPSFYLAKPEQHGSVIWTVNFQPSHEWLPRWSPSATPQQRQCQPHSARQLQLRLWPSQVLRAAELSIPHNNTQPLLRLQLLCQIWGACFPIPAPCWTELWPQHCQVFIMVLRLRYRRTPAANASLGETSFHYKYNFSLPLCVTFCSSMWQHSRLKLHWKCI